MSGIFNGLAYDCLDLEGKRDWLDGWHEAADLGFKSPRSETAVRLHLEFHPAPKACEACCRVGHQTQCQHHEVSGADCMEAGRLERRAIREARGV